MVRSPALFFVVWLSMSGLMILAGCGPCPVEDDSAAPPPTPSLETKVPPVRLQEASAGGVLILEEDDYDSGIPGPAEGGDGLSERPAAPLPEGHQGFRDHHLVLYVSDTSAGLAEAIQAATESGGQLINYPISGFEDLGPDERTLVFDARTYPDFIRRLESLGDAEYAELGSSDFVTVRLTVREKE